MASPLASLLPNAFQQFLDANGNPLAAGQVFMYVPNTTTFKTTWQDAGEVVPNPIGQAITLNGAGEALIYGSGQYRQVVLDRHGNQIWDGLTQDVLSLVLQEPVTGPGVPGDVIIFGAAGFSADSGVQISNFIQAFPTIAALRAATVVTLVTSQVSVGGYSAPQDAGGGFFAYVPTDTTSADNGGTIIVDGANRRWYRQQGGQKSLNLWWFGGNMLSDYSPVLNLMFTAATALATAGAAGVEFIIPPGTFNCNTLVTFNYPGTTPFRVAIRGSGSDISILNWAMNTSGLVFNMAIPQHTIHMSEMTLSTASVGVAAGITCNQASPQALFGQNEFQNLTFRGSDQTVLNNYWLVGLQVFGLGNINFEGLLVYGHPAGGTSSLGTGVSVNGLTSGANPFGIVYNFTNCSFWELANCIVYGTNVQGMTIEACNFTNSTNGVFQPVTAVGGAQLSVVNSQFGCFQNAMLLGGALNNIQFSNNLVLVSQNNGTGIGMTGSGAEMTFIGNVFSTFGGPQPGTNGIDFNVATATYGTGTISGNTFQGFVTGVNLTGAGFFVVSQNRYVGCTNNTVNPGGSGVNSVAVLTD